MKTCPSCAEAIQDAAVVCRFCQRPYPSASAQRAAILATDARNKQRFLVVLIVGVLLAAAVGIGALLVYQLVFVPVFHLPGIGDL